jgi:hypothetical protein
MGYEDNDDDFGFMQEQETEDTPRQFIDFFPDDEQQQETTPDVDDDEPGLDWGFNPSDSQRGQSHGSKKKSKKVARHIF